jgi:hypothetical protein
VAVSTGGCNTLDAVEAKGVLQMKRRPRIYYSAEQRALIWDRWQKSETLHQIAHLFDRYHSSIRGILAETGGIREEISRAVVAGCSMRSIAMSLGRAVDHQPRNTPPWGCGKLSGESS